jgi:hypothetical protein
MEPVIQWLLQGDPWVEYHTHLDLLHQFPNEPEASKARYAMIAHPLVRKIIDELSGWSGAALSSHKSAGQPMHKLSFLADLGLDRSDEDIGFIAEKIMKHQSDQGPFQMMMNIPTHFGGNGEDIWAWALCDAPVILYALVKFGYGDDERVKRGIQYLAGLVRENGWPCTVSPEAGKFRGPGRKEDPCPYATLVMLKLLSALPDWQESEPAHTGAESLLSVWNNRKEQHPYMFYMGTDFCKLKAPLVWYDILHVCEVLSQFPWLHGDPRLLQMLEIIAHKADENGCYTPESIWTAWKDWEFGQKKVPSRWLTLLIIRIQVRMNSL